MTWLYWRSRESMCFAPRPINQGEKLRQKGREYIGWPCGWVPAALLSAGKALLLGHSPGLLSILGALHLLGVCALFMSDLSPSWSLSPGGFLFPNPNTCPHCSLTPREIHISRSGDLLECSPKGTSKEQLSCWDWINGI